MPVKRPTKPVKKAAPKKAVTKKTAPSKKAPPKKTAPPPAPTAASVSKKDFDAFKKQVLEGVAALSERLDLVQVLAGGFDPAYVSVTDDGAYKLDIENADRFNLRTWAWQLGFDDTSGETEALRAALVEMRDADDFAGFNFVRADFPPEEGDEEEAAEEPAAEEEPEEETAEEEEEDEEGDASPEDVLAALPELKWKDLKDIADQMELDYADISKPPQVKVLRNRIQEALEAMLSGEEEEAEEEPEAKEEETELEAGAAITITHEGETYEGVFVRFDDDGDVVFTWPDDEEEQAVSADQVEAA